MALLAKDATRPLRPVELPAMRVLLTMLGCALAVFAAVTLLVHGQLTSHFDHALLDSLAAPKGSWAAQAAVAVTSLGDSVPVLTILVLAGALAPVRWGGGWRLLLLPWTSATVAFLCASVIKDAMARARPPESGWASPARGFAFPSGHATTATAGYLVAGWALGAAVAAATLAVTRRAPTVTRGSSPALEPPQ
jgi:hypothetical protein